MNRFEIWILGWTEIANGLIEVISFGFFNLGLDYKFCKWATQRKIKKKQKEV